MVGWVHGEKIWTGDELCQQESSGRGRGQAVSYLAGMKECTANR